MTKISDDLINNDIPAVSVRALRRIRMTKACRKLPTEFTNRCVRHCHIKKLIKKLKF